MVCSRKCVYCLYSPRFPTRPVGICSRKCVYCLYSPRFSTRPVGICSGKCVYCRAICFVDHHTHTFDVTLNSCLTKQSFTAHYCVTRSSTHHLNSQGWGLYLVTYVHMLSSLVRCADFRFFCSYGMWKMIGVGSILFMLVC